MKCEKKDKPKGEKLPKNAWKEVKKLLKGKVDHLPEPATDIEAAEMVKEVLK